MDLNSTVAFNDKAKRRLKMNATLSLTENGIAVQPIEPGPPLLELAFNQIVGINRSQDPYLLLFTKDKTYSFYFGMKQELSKTRVSGQGLIGAAVGGIIRSAASKSVEKSPNGFDRQKWREVFESHGIPVKKLKIPMWQIITIIVFFAAAIGTLFLLDNDPKSEQPPATYPTAPTYTYNTITIQTTPTLETIQTTP